jgi:uncharacterized protein YgbK (DUF1537 family)
MSLFSIVDFFLFISCLVGTVVAFNTPELRMVVIADDLTGANDTAIQYRKYGISSIVNVGLAENQNPQYFSGYDVISVNTDSRALSPSAAYEAVYKTCRLFCPSGTDDVYKKTDSLMRGNPGAELDAVMDALQCGVAFVSPSYPENGRIMSGGILHAGGNRIDAVKSLASDMKRTVCSVPLPVVQDGAAAIAAYVAAERKNNGAVFVFDACTDTDLEHIYRMTGIFGERFVLCGSAGLARFDAMKLAASVKPAGHAVVRERDGIVLAVTGSRNAETRAQVLKASSDLHVPCIVMDKELVVAGKPEQAVERCMEEAGRWIRKGNRVLLVAVSSLFSEFHMVLKDSAENYRIAYNLAVCLGRLAESIYHTFPVRGIISNGGDTTMQMCSCLGVYGIEPLVEVMPGTPMGVLIGGEADRIPVITKSGGFGDDSVLTECISFLQNYKNGK